MMPKQLIDNNYKCSDCNSSNFYYSRPDEEVICGDCYVFYPTVNTVPHISDDTMSRSPIRNGFMDDKLKQNGWFDRLQNQLDVRDQLFNDLIYGSG